MPDDNSQIDFELVPGRPVPLRVAAKYLSRNERTIRNLEKSGSVRLIRIGDGVFMPYDELRRLSEHGDQTPGPPVPVAS